MPRRRLPAEGLRETLEDLEGAVHYNRWIAGMMDPYLGRRVLEIGCGTGNITLHLAEKTRGRGLVLGVDSQGAFLAAARRRLSGQPHVSFRSLDLEKGVSSLRSFRPDTVLCVNVLEHVLKDAPLVADVARLLPPGGRFLAFVPALPALFGSMDEQYGHHRRYLKGSLERLFREAGLDVLHCRYLNLLGIFGWWWNGQVLKRRLVPKGQILLYDRVVAVTGKFERYLPRPIGLSLFCVGEVRAARP